MFKRFFICMLLCAMPVAGLNISRAQSTDSRTLSATVTIYRDLVRFAVAEARQLRIELFNQKNEKVFDSDFVSGAALDWFIQDQHGQAVDSGLYSYLISIRKESGETVEAQRGNVILDRERQNLTDAPPQKVRPDKGDIRPLTAGVFDVNATGGSYNINTPLMGIGTAEPLARLHIGAESKEPATAGATVLIEEGSQSSMVMRSTSGAEMFLIQNGVGGVIGTATDSPLSLRTNNLDRVTIDISGRVGIGTSAPSAKLHVSGDGLVTGNLTVSGTLNANLPSGSTNYIQNTGSQQANTNFNIGGNGTLGGTLAASLVNATTQYNLGGQRVLSIGGSVSNLFAGVDAGSNNTTGVNNSFFGKSAGFANSSGAGNSFFGTAAGQANSTGTVNAFFGAFAGGNNTTGGSNAFFGGSAGTFNTTGGANSFFGRQAGYANTSGYFNAFFGESAGYSNSTGVNNSFFGRQAGYLNTTGNGNSFFGTSAGYSNSTGGVNSFFGVSAGGSNSTGSANAFFGASAGSANTTGIANSFFGHEAGVYNTTASGNSFFGNRVGNANTTGFSNSFFGASAGNVNSTGSANLFAGHSAAIANTTGSKNVIIGTGAGASNTIENENTFLGYNANGATAINNATAVGAKASVTLSDSLVLGSINGINSATASVNVGIGTTAPGSPLEVRRDGNVGGNWQTAQLRISGSTDPAMQLNLGYDTTSNLGVIQPGHAGFAFKNLSLNPSGGNVGVGTVSPADRLDVNGIIRVSTLGSAGSTQLCRNASNQISTCSSSLRYKNEIRPFNFGLALINRLRPVTYNWKASGERDLGLVAEEVAEVEPLLVTTNDKGQVEGVKYDRINVALVNAVKELGAEKDAQVAALKAENAALEQRHSAQIALLQQQNARLSERLTALEKNSLNGASHRPASARGRRPSSKPVSSH